MRRAPLLLFALLLAGPGWAQFVAPGGVIPVVANLPGLNDTFWRSDVSILNVTSQATSVVLRLYPEIRGGSPAFAAIAIISAVITLIAENMSAFRSLRVLPAPNGPT